MRRSILFWILAFLTTVVVATYQRVTGPTYPVAGTLVLGDKTIAYELDRSHGGESRATIRIRTDDPAVEGVVEWRRYKTDDDWLPVNMNYTDGSLTADLPRQPPAGKLEYRITLQKGVHAVSIPPREPVVIRFRGEVPVFILIPHILTMFGAMLLSTRAGLEFFAAVPRVTNLTYWTLGLLFAGGLLLGPIVQKYAFGAYWTGWPLGHDLTDNKTAVAFIGWVVAALAYRRSAVPQRWALGAAVLLLLVYLIPHSVLGSELDYKEINKRKPVELAR